MDSPTHASIAIIGAGVAGLAAAEHFTNSGQSNVVIIDKAQNVGGRCATRRVSKSADSPWFDHGAQYFTARHADFQRHCTNQLASKTLKLWRPQLGVWQDGQLTTSNDNQDRYIATKGLNPWLRQQAATLEQSGARLKLNHKVTQLEKIPQGWIISVDQQAPIHADYLVITAPPEQTLKLLGSNASKAAQVIQKYQSEACWSITATGPKLAFEGVFFRQHPALSWAANNYSKQATQLPALWTLHANPAWSSDNINLQPEQAAEALIAHFAASTGTNPKSFSAIHQHRWRYARPSTQTPPRPPSPYLSFPTSTLAIAGDWLAGGRVEGAWLSGRGVAEEIQQNQDNLSSTAVKSA